MRASPLPPSLLDTCNLCHLFDVKPCTSSSAFFSVFWPILIILNFEWSQLIHRFSDHTAPLPSRCGPVRVHRLQLVLLSPSWSIMFFLISCKILVVVPFFVFFDFYIMIRQDGKFLYSVNCLFFSWLLLCLVVWPRVGDQFLSQNSWELFVSFSMVDSGFCMYYLVVWSNLNFLRNSQGITLPTQS